MQLGAAVAGADDTALGLCTALGLPLGEAFQIRDDLLDVFGSADGACAARPGGPAREEAHRSPRSGPACGHPGATASTAPPGRPGRSRRTGGGRGAGHPGGDRRAAAHRAHDHLPV
nr:polyprenyl synthetase family protein [Streptomyces akebiae]